MRFDLLAIVFIVAILLPFAIMVVDRHVTYDKQHRLLTQKRRTLLYPSMAGALWLLGTIWGSFCYLMLLVSSAPHQTTLFALEWMLGMYGLVILLLLRSLIICERERHT